MKERCPYWRQPVELNEFGGRCWRDAGHRGPCEYTRTMRQVWSVIKVRQALTAGH